MLLGALLAVGADPTALDPVESALSVRYAVDSTIKNGISATTVDVLLTDGATAEHGHDTGHTHDEP